MEEFNIYGWSALHEACYKGYTNAVSRFLDYAKETEKNLIEFRTIDELKTTPVIIAALGGHLEVVDLLVKNGADVNAELEFQNKKHGIIEVAAIRGHIELLVYLNDKIFDIPKRLRNLLISKNLDKQSRASIGRTIEKLSQDYMSIFKKVNNLKQINKDVNLKENLSAKESICYETMQNEEFGLCLANYFQLNKGNEDAIASGVIILLNVIEDEQIRNKFMDSKGISYLVSYMEDHKRNLSLLNETYQSIIKKNKPKREKKRFYLDYSDDEDEDENNDPIQVYKNKLLIEDDTDDGIYEEKEEKERKNSWIECASIGQAFNALCKYNDSLLLINKDGSNEKIITYIKILFDYINFSRLFEHLSERDIIYEDLLNKNNFLNSYESDSIIFEQFIGPYLSCLGNLVFHNDINKVIFQKMNLFEQILTFWNQIIFLTNSNKKNKSQYFTYGFKFLKNYIDLNEILIDQVSLSNYQKSDKLERTGTNLDFLSQKSDLTSLNKILSNMSIGLIRSLKLIIIECLGKVINHNYELKKMYIYPYKSNLLIESSNDSKENYKDHVLIAVDFIRKLFSNIEKISFIDREIQLEILRFLWRITENDTDLQNLLVDIDLAFESSLIINLRNLLRKSSPIHIRELTMFSVWSLAGGNNTESSFERQSVLYRAIGAQKFVDTLYDSDEKLTLICLEAIRCISNALPYRENDTNKLVHAQEDIAKVNSVPVVMKFLNSKIQNVVFATLNTLSAMCVSHGYYNCSKNQNEIVDHSGFGLIIEIANNQKYSNRLRCEAYFCLSMICLNNSKNRIRLFKELYNKQDNLVKDIMLFLKTSNSSDSIEEELNVLETQLIAGLTFCAFCFHNEEFRRKIVLTVGRFNWDLYQNIFDRLEKLEEKTDKAKNFHIKELKIYFAFQIIALHNLFIDEPVEDPRIIGLQILVQTIPKNDNLILKSIACDYIGRLICINDCLIESLMSLDAIELLADCIVYPGNDKNKTHDNTVVGIAAITLGYFTTLNPEARRKVLRYARKKSKVIIEMKYFNEALHVDLLTQWNHFKELNDSIHKINRLDVKKSNQKPFVIIK